MSEKSRTIGLDIIMAVEYKKAFFGQNTRESLDMLFCRKGR